MGKILTSPITGLTFEQTKEIHKNDTPEQALDQLCRLSLAPEYVKPNSVEEQFRVFLYHKALSGLKERKILKDIIKNLISIDDSDLSHLKIRVNFANVAVNQDNLKWLKGALEDE